MKFFHYLIKLIHEEIIAILRRSMINFQG